MQEGLGSGVLVKRAGQSSYVLTNNHVVGEAEEINVRLADGRSYKAKLVGKDPKKELALVVGINSWIASTSGGNVGLGFAIPINNAKSAIEDFITKGKVSHGWSDIRC